MPAKQIWKGLLLLLLQPGEDLGFLHEVPERSDGVVMPVSRGRAAALLRLLVFVIVIFDVRDLAVLLGVAVVHQLALEWNF